jgi:hypothetical protein
MQFTNFNIFSILIFIIILVITAFLTYKKYNFQINFNKKYKLLASDKNFYLKYIFLIISLFILMFSIFWIKYSSNTKQVQNEWIDVMFVLDVSKSMNVADITDWNYNYTRLDIAKKAIWDYIVKNENNRYWLVIFAWDAISTIPLTTDHDLFLTMLSWVDYRNLTVQGSDFQKAIDLWINRFILDKERSKALVFISDWGDNWDKININWDYSKNIAYFVVWVWTKQGWKIIKWRDAFNRISYQRYKWEYVISKLNLDNLENIASKLNADLFELKNISDLRKINSKLEKLEKKAITKNNLNNLNSYSRNLTIFSLIFFIIFLITYIFENKINLWKKQ